MRNTKAARLVIFLLCLTVFAGIAIIAGEIVISGIFNSLVDVIFEALTTNL